jgi:hypothetical protein
MLKDRNTNIPPMSVILTSNVYVPAAEGVPEIVPLEFKVNPVGKLPLSTVNVGDIPVSSVPDKVTE